MKKLLLAAAGLATAVTLGGWLETSDAQQSAGTPNEPFGVLINKQPTGLNQFALPTSPGYQKLPAMPQPGMEFLSGTPRPPAAESEKTSAIREFLNQNFDAPDPNQDIAIRTDCGKWAICIHSYSGKDAAAMGREMVVELRGNPAYKMNAFTHRRGVEDCKAEQKHIRDEIEKQRQMLADKALPADMPVRIPVIRYEIQYAVLLAGYKDMESAKQAIMDLRAKEKAKKLPPLDINKVKLNMQYVMKCDEKGAPVDGGYVPVSPFAQCMVCPNPTVKTNRDTGISAEDLALMKQLNAHEIYSLLKCPKPLTLAVKQFSVPSEIPTAKSTSMSFLDKIGLGSSNTKPDTAAISAQNLADLLRKGKFEAYVLHMEFSSFVTVGSYDREDDPRIARDRDLLAQINVQLNPAIRLAAQPRLMAVPK